MITVSTLIYMLLLCPPNSKMYVDTTNQSTCLVCDNATQDYTEDDFVICNMSDSVCISVIPNEEPIEIIITEK